MSSLSLLIHTSHGISSFQVSKEHLSAFKPSGNPLKIPSNSDFSDRSNLHKVLVLKEDFQFLRLGSKMGPVLSDRTKLFNTWMLEESDLIQDAAKSYGHRLISEQFNKVIDQSDKSTREILTDLYRLYAVSLIINDVGFYIRHELMDSGTVNKFQEYQDQLCAKLSPMSLDLVDAFGLDNDLLNVPIAMDWVKYNSVDNQGELNSDWL